MKAIFTEMALQTGEYDLRPKEELNDPIPGALPQATVNNGLRPNQCPSKQGRCPWLGYGIPDPTQLAQFSAKKGSLPFFDGDCVD